MFRSHPKVLYLLQHSSSQWAYVGPTCKGQAITTLPPPLPVSVSLAQELWKTGMGRGHCWSSPDSYAPARVSHGSDPSRYDMAAVISDRSPITTRELPCKRAGAKTMFWPATEEVGDEEGWGGEPERGGMGGGGGGKGVGIICASKTLLFYLLSEKKLWGRCTGIFSHTIFWAVAIIITFMIRSSLKDWQSMKKVHTCTAQCLLSLDY